MNEDWRIDEHVMCAFTYHCCNLRTSSALFVQEEPCFNTATVYGVRVNKEPMPENLGQKNKAHPQRKLVVHYLSNNNFHGYFVTPGCLRITFFPCSCSVYLEHIFTSVTDLDTMFRNGSSKDQSHDVVVQIAVFEIGDVKTFETISFFQSSSSP